jgi:hypothetical protein
MFGATSLITNSWVLVTDLSGGGAIDGPASIVVMIVAPLHVINVSVVERVAREVLDAGRRLLDITRLVAVDLGVAGASDRRRNRCA